MTRREAIALAAAPLLAADRAPVKKLPVCAFSKHFQWLDWKDSAALMAELGYDGVDLTLRAGGHVLPERVADDLPKAFEVYKAAGLSMPMTTAGIVDVTSPHAEAMVKTMAALGIRRYRWGGFRYHESQPVQKQIAEFTAKSRDLAALNKAHGVCAMYHTHSGVGQFGSSMWDIWNVVKDLDRSAVSINLDIGHATVEGGLGGWINTSRLVLPYSRGVAVKDFYWAKNAKGAWAPRWCALGQGMVNLRQFFGYVKSSGFEGPIQLHLEYEELGDAHSGKTKSTIPRDEFVRLMKQDLATLRQAMEAAGLS
jgi:sugar phosphate isomerase/epimerase